MKRLKHLLLIATLVGGTAAAANSPIAGTWQGKTGDVPAVTLTVKDEGGKLSGTAVFYKILDDGSGPKVAGKDTSALINAKFEGKIFSFEVKGSGGELVDFRMELTGKNEGRLTGKTTQTGDTEPPAVKMIREQ